MVADLKQCVEHAEKYGVIIGIQNHGDMLKSADQVIKIIKMVDSPWFGAINDTGYYLTPDPYADMARVVPYTVNWQVKQRLGGKEGTTPMDLKRLVRPDQGRGLSRLRSHRNAFASGKGVRPFHVRAAVPQGGAAGNRRDGMSLPSGTASPITREERDCVRCVLRQVMPPSDIRV